MNAPLWLVLDTNVVLVLGAFRGIAMLRVVECLAVIAALTEPRE